MLRARRKTAAHSAAIHKGKAKKRSVNIRRSHPLPFGCCLLNRSSWSLWLARPPEVVLLDLQRMAMMSGRSVRRVIVSVSSEPPHVGILSVVHHLDAVSATLSAWSVWSATCSDDGLSLAVGVASSLVGCLCGALFTVSILSCLPTISAQRFGLGIRAGFGGQNCQYTTKVDAR